MKHPEIASVVFSYYPADPRVRRESEAMVESGASVDVFCLKQEHESKHETVNGVNVYRIPLQRRRGAKVRYLFEYLAFITMAFFYLAFYTIKSFKNRYAIVHIHNMPDVLVFSSLIPRLLGAKIILDLHDPMPEVFMAKYSWPDRHPAVLFLQYLEKISIRYSHVVLTPNKAFQRLFTSRGCPPGKIHIVMNAPQESIFGSPPSSSSFSPPFSGEKPLQIMYHGTITERNGLGVALEALQILKEEYPKWILHVYGEGDFLETFLKKKSELGLDDHVVYHGYAPAEKIAAALREIDIGLIPNQASVHWDHAFPTRLFEYLSQGKPVIAPRTRGILDYFDEQSLYLFESGDAVSLAEALWKFLNQNDEDRRRMLHRGVETFRQHRWIIQRRILLEVVNSLV
ncbi:MAG: glycosyltransferase family 4 protein [Candidatus Omnitrophica bacterium]|nr:glycosyltransferase family 4 protein [Candidatus Omnitrophota bacterium]